MKSKFYVIAELVDRDALPNNSYSPKSILVSFQQEVVLFCIGSGHGYQSAFVSFKDVLNDLWICEFSGTGAEWFVDFLKSDSSEECFLQIANSKNIKVEERYI